MATPVTRVFRVNGVLALAVAAVGAVQGVSVAQTATSTAPAAPSFDSALMISPPATTVPADRTAAAPAPAATRAVASTAPAATMPEVAPVTQAFVATVSAENVYVRSGPGSTYYELGKLTKGDLVYVVGTKSGWYQILPPNGTFCLIAKEFVDVDAGGAAATVKADYVNVRAGTAINRNRDPFAVLTVVRKGTKLKVLAVGEKYVEIAPPERAFVYVSPQFVKQASVGYKVPDLKLPTGATGPTQTTVTLPETLPTAVATAGAAAGGTAGTIEIPTVPTPAAGTGGGTTTMILPPSKAEGETPPATATGAEVATTTQGGTSTVIRPPSVAPVPAVTYSQTATQKFNDLNTRYQAEGRKPLAEQDVTGLLKEYKELLGMENISPSVKLGTESRVTALEKVAAIQRMTKDSAAKDDSLAQQRQALREQYAAAEKAITDYQASGAYLAEGLLQTSTIVQGKYALVNPATGRVAAYVDPASDVDIGTLLGKYIGVRGITSTPTGTEIKVIKVTNATLMAPPKGSK